MEAAVLREVREAIEGMYVSRDEGFVLPARYKTLVKIEASLLAYGASVRTAEAHGG